MKNDYLDIFQGKYQKFVVKHALPEKKYDKVLIKYFATLEELIEKPVSRIPPFKKYIWTREYVNYMTAELHTSGFKSL